MKKILLGLAIACFGFAANSNAQTILSQDFESATIPSMPTGWTAATTGGGLGWQTTNTTTNLYFGTVPSHTVYAILDDYSNPKNNPATMTSPTFTLTGYANPYMSYDFFFYGAYTKGVDTAEQCYVQVYNGGSWVTIDSAAAGGQWETHFLSLGAYSGATQLRFSYTDGGANLIGVAIDNIQIFNAQPNDIALIAVTPLAGDPAGDFVTKGGAATFGGTIRNLSPTTITSFSADYSVAGGTPVTTSLTGSIAPMATGTFTCSTYTDGVLGVQPVQMWVTETGDPVLTNDSMNTTIYAVDSMPTKRVLFEEGTGMWCGYCVRGIIYMDSLYKLYPNSVSIVAVHDQLNGTDMLAAENTQTQDYDKFISYFPGFTGYPTIIADRRALGDPSDAFTMFNNATSNFGFASLGLTVSYSGTSLNAAVTVRPVMPLSGDYRLAMVITENKAHNNAYYQHNYYSYTDLNQPLSGVGYNFQDSVESIPGSSMYFNFVDRYSAPDFYTTGGGVAGSLPSTMTAETLYPYNFAAVTMPSDWDTSNLKVVVMLIDNNPKSNTYEQVLNSISAAKYTPDHTGVANIVAGINEMKVFPNPSKDQAHVTFDLAQACNVAFHVYDALGREVFNVPAEDMPQGGQEINFSTSSLASGVYSVVIATPMGMVSQHLVVAK